MAWTGLSKEHEDEIAARGLDVSLAEMLGVWSDGKAIAFDYLRADGRVHNTKLRRGKGDMPWAQQGLPLIPWNVGCLEGEAADRALIIVEGEFDGWAMVQSGFYDVISVPNGAPSSDKEEGKKRYSYLYRGEDLHPSIAKFETIILAVDNDEKGLFLREALTVRLGVRRCRYVQWPTGCKDANDVLRIHGEDELRSVVTNAKRVFSSEVATLRELPDPPPERAFPLGFMELEKVEYKGMRGHSDFEIIYHIKMDSSGKPADPLSGHLLFPEEGIVTIVGPYENGKSTFVRQIIHNMKILHGWRSAITCFEEKAKWRTVNALRKTYIGKQVTLMSDREMEVADDWIDESVVFLQKDYGRITDGARLMQLIKYTIEVYGVNMVVIDPFNEIDHSWNRQGKSKTDYIGDFLMELREIAKEFHCLMIVCVHPPTATINKKKVSGEPYTLIDAADSSMFANKSDVGLGIWMPGTDGYALLNPDKIKNRDLLGQPIGIELRFDGDTDRFYVSRLGWNVFEKEGINEQ